MQTFLRFLIAIFLIAMLILIIINPIILAIVYGNALWLFAYFLVIPELVVFAIIGKILIEMVD